jgi:hypothetical protein
LIEANFWADQTHSGLLLQTAPKNENWTAESANRVYNARLRAYLPDEQRAFGAAGVESYRREKEVLDYLQRQGISSIAIQPNLPNIILDNHPRVIGMASIPLPPNEPGLGSNLRVIRGIDTLSDLVDIFPLLEQKAHTSPSTLTDFECRQLLDFPPYQKKLRTS